MQCSEAPAPHRASLVPTDALGAAAGTGALAARKVLVPGLHRKPSNPGMELGNGEVPPCFLAVGGQMVLSSPSTGTRSPGAADLTSREVSILDTDSQAGDDGEAFDFFPQQEQGEGPSTPGQKGEDAEQSSEEEEALDPLGIMR